MPQYSGPSGPQTLISLMEDGISARRNFSILGRSGVTDRASLDEMWDDAAHVAAGLLDRGPAPGDRIGVVGSTSLEFVVACLAVWRAGMALVPLPGRGRNVTRDEWTRVARDRLDRARAKAVIGPSDADLGVLGATVPDLRAKAPATVDPHPDDVALVQFSSGTTSRPKGTVLPHRTMVERLHLRAKAAGGTGVDEHVLRWNPMHTGAAISSAVCQPFARGIEVSILPTRLFTADPARWLREIERRNVTHSGGPTFAYDLAARAIERGLGGPVDLSGWRSASASGEVIDPAVLVRFASLASPLGFDEFAFQTRYMSSEAGFVTDGREGSGLRIESLDREMLSRGVARSSEERDSTSFLSNGPPIPGVDIRIVDPEGGDLPERRIGEIRVHSPGVASGYIEDPEQTEAAFEGSWYRSGDAGFVDRGELFVTGRVKDMIIVRGANLYAEDVEAVVHAALPDVTCCAFGIRGASSEEVVLALEPVGEGVQEDAASVARSAVWRALGVSVKDVVEVSRGAFPRTDSGKLQRHHVKAQYEGGTILRAGGSS